MITGKSSEETIIFFGTFVLVSRDLFPTRILSLPGGWLLCWAWLGLTHLVYGQEEGRIRRVEAIQKVYLFGRVIDKQSGEGLAGATVQLGIYGAYTDGQGRFVILYERSGDTLTVSFPEYRTKSVIITQPGGVVVGLEPFEVEVGEVQIVGEMDRETEAAVAVERLRSLEFGESYTAENIMKRTTDFYVPNVLRRLPGVSILSGRWISIRGLGERYNAFAFWAAYPAWLRYDASMPAINEVVSTLLGRVDVRKVWTPELLGHFGGGMIDFQLPESGEEGLTVAFTGEIGSWGLGQRYPVIRGNWKRWNNEALPDPAEVQATAPDDRPLPQNFLYARQYQKPILPDTASLAPPGPLLTLSYNRSGERLQVALRLIYGQRYNCSMIRFSDGVFDSTDGAWSYQEYLSASTKPVWNLTRNFGFSSSVISNFSQRHRLSLSLLGLNMLSQRHTLEQGTYYNDYIGANLWLWYSTILLEQSRLGIARLRYHVQGRKWHFAAESGVIAQQYTVPYSGAMNYAIPPQDSILRYETQSWGTGEIYVVSWHSRAYSVQLYTHPSVERRWGNEGRWVSLRIGGWYSYEPQRNRARTMGLVPDTTSSTILTPEILALENITSIYDESYRVAGGFWLLDRTSDYHRWRGLTQIAAAYAMLRLGYKGWEIMGGARYEYYERQLKNLPLAETAYQPFLRERTGDWLPSVIGKYRLSENSHLRIGAYRTLIRPPVPAQVPLPYFDYTWAFYWGGDPTYRTGSAWNFDLRWEKVRGTYQLWAVGVFYKAFRALPEIYLEPATYTEVFTFKTRNRSYGEVAGIEVEARQILWGSELNPQLWMYVNGTISESGGHFWKAFRDPYNERLQGQAPYTINAGMVSQPVARWEVSSFLNYTGPQIWAMGFDQKVYPHIIERGRTFWEWQVSRKIGRLEVRVSVWDVLNQPFRRIQKVGNAERAYDPEQDAQPSWQREEWRFYLTLRYRVF